MKAIKKAEKYLGRFNRLLEAESDKGIYYVTEYYLRKLVSANEGLLKEIEQRDAVIEAAKVSIKIHNRFHEYINANDSFPPDITSEDMSNSWSNLSEALSQLEDK